MRRKRLKHAAQNLCQIFCGWRLINSYRDLERWGSGILVIDALDGSCQFDGEPVPPTAIAGELHAWLEDDLRSSGIPREALRYARLTASLRFTSVTPRDRVTRDQHFTEGVHLGSVQFNRVAILCFGEVATDEVVYRADYRDVEEWPIGWPET